MALHEAPDIDLRATDPIRDDPQFISRLEAEVEEIDDEIPGWAAAYPILNLGLSFGL